MTLTREGEPARLQAADMDQSSYFGAIGSSRLSPEILYGNPARRNRRATPGSSISPFRLLEARRESDCDCMTAPGKQNSPDAASQIPARRHLQVAPVRGLATISMDNGNSPLIRILPGADFGGYGRDPWRPGMAPPGSTRLRESSPPPIEGRARLSGRSRAVHGIGVAEARLGGAHATTSI